MPRIVKKPDVRKKEIIQAARKLFLTKNYDATSMQRVVDSLDIAKGTIYHYFPSKEALLEAVVEDIVEEDHQHKKKFLQELQGNALEKLQKLVQVKSLADQHEGLLENMHQPGNVDLHIRILAKAVVKEATLFAELIEQGCKEGIFHTNSPLECAELMLAGIHFLTDIGIHPWKDDELNRRIQAAPQLMEALLGAPKGSFDFMIPRLKQAQ